METLNWLLNTEWFIPLAASLAVFFPMYFALSSVDEKKTRNKRR